MSAGAAWGRTPPTRWSGAAAESRYAENMARLLADGEDVDGEARLADALLPRGARVLDVGSGMGRVAAALTSRGHDVVAVEPDPALAAQSRSTWPDLPVLEADVLALDAARLRAAGRPDAFDLAICVGNVLPYTAPDTERAVLARIAGLLAPGGRVLAGLHLADRPPGTRPYPVEELAADAATAGLVVQHHFGGYELEPPDPAYAVLVLARA